MRYENHVFISYAHIDNQPLVEGEDGWVSNLHRALEIRVAQLAGATPRIWRDPKLAGNDLFADSLIDNLRSVAALVSVVSPRYVNSEWCVRELRQFCDVAESGEGVRVGNKSRLFKVVKTPVPLDEQPGELHPLLGYEFFKQDPASGRCQEFDKVFGQQAQIDFWARLDDLAHDVAGLLAALDPDSKETGDAGDDTGHTVYLADTSSDLREPWEAIRRDLRQQGVRVLPEAGLPLVASALEETVRQELEKSDLSIHLLGKSYGLVPEGTTASVVELQYDIASRLGAEHALKRLVWLPRDLEVEDDRELDFVARVRSDPAMAADADLLETPLEDLKTVIHEFLHPPDGGSNGAGQNRAETAGETPATIYLICDREDEEAVAELQDYLFDQGFEVLLPVFEGDASEIREDHEESLRSCDAVLLYYGSGSELWLRRKLRELHKIAGYGRSEPIAARAICVAPPANPKKEKLRTREALVLPLADAEPHASLRPFLTELHEAGKGAPE